MVIRAIKTRKVRPGELDLISLIDESVTELSEGSVLAITSKVVSLCEGRVLPIGSVDKDELTKEESDYYLPVTAGKYDYYFTIANNTLISMGGIDESNGDGMYILWPKDPQKTANEIRANLSKKFGLQKVGVLIVDSTCIPLRRGTMGITIAHSGFNALKNYIGKPDLFGKPFKVSVAGIANGLAANAVLAMGEGTEQTPFCLIEDLSFVEFQDRDPTEDELGELYVPLEEDLYAPFLLPADWQKGKLSNSRFKQNNIKKGKNND
jgi:dihydrofolate synthase / folylpolyglutamate synthase